MRSLFSGWVGEGYIVDDETLVCTPAGKNLVTEQTFSNYILEFDFKLQPGGNNGLGIHYPGNGDNAYT
ncbi:MAG: family 16 glycoside hydrolase [Verrucomicrobiota bacterium]